MVNIYYICTMYDLTVVAKVQKQELVHCRPNATVRIIYLDLFHTNLFGLIKAYMKMCR